MVCIDWSITCWILRHALHASPFCGARKGFNNTLRICPEMVLPTHASHICRALAMQFPMPTKRYLQSCEASPALTHYLLLRPYGCGLTACQRQKAELQRQKQGA